MGTILRILEAVCEKTKRYVLICVNRVRIIALFISAWLYNRKGNCTDGSIALVFYGGLGDFVIWLAAAKALRELYINRRITLCCNAAFRELAKATGYFDQVIVDERNPNTPGFFSRWRARKNFESVECDTLLQCFYMEDMVAAAIKARKKLCVSRNVTHKLQQKLLRLIYDDCLPFDEKTEHYILQQTHYLQFLGWKGKAGLPDLPSAAPPIKILQPYFVIFPGAFEPLRCWNVDKFAQVALFIARKYNLACCVCGGKQEIDKAYTFQKLCSGKMDLYNEVGKTTVLDLIALIQGACFVLTNDTSSVHIAAASRTPSVCISGILDPRLQALPYPVILGEKFLPLICKACLDCRGCACHYTKECIECMHLTGRWLCIESVTVPQVIKAVEEVFKCHDSGCLNI